MPKNIVLARDADCLYTQEQINQVLDKLAQQLERDYAGRDPVLLCVMTGAVLLMGQLLSRVSFPLQIDYVHVSRYGDKTQGGELIWHAKPRTSLTDRHVVLIEDIYDEGPTLIALREFCRQAGAASVACMALADKQHARKNGQPPEYIGLTVPDRYVFGFGMDVEGYWRNLPGIFALKETAT